MKCAKAIAKDCRQCADAHFCEIPGLVKRLQGNIKQLTMAMDCELRDPCGPIWDHLHKENERLKELLDQVKEGVKSLG